MAVDKDRLQTACVTHDRASALVQFADLSAIVAKSTRGLQESDLLDLQSYIMLRLIEIYDRDKWLPDGGNCALTYYFNAARLATRTWSRRHHRRLQLTPLSLDMPAPSGEGSLHDITPALDPEPHGDDVAILLSRCTDRERDLIDKHFYQGMTNQEIADLSGISRQAVNLVIQKALKKMRK